MTPKHLILSLCFLCLILSRATAPLYELNLAERFYERVEGGLWARKRAYDGFVKWPAEFGHTQQEIWNLIEKESNFEVAAYSKRQARGLMQPRESAIKTLKDWRKFYFYKKNIDGRRIRLLNKKRVYDPFWNIYIGCSYFRTCKNMARRHGPVTWGDYSFSTNRMASAFYVTGWGNFQHRIKKTLLYIQNIQE